MENRKQRKGNVNRAIALSTLDAEAPSEFAMGLAEQYIENEIDQEEMTRQLIEHYKED